MRRASAALLSNVLVVSALTLGVPMAVHALDAADLPGAIENATTAADHEAIAAYYDTEAQAARSTAERHRGMAGAYAKLPKHAGHRGARASVYRTMPPHCNDLVKSYDTAARDYEAMAAAHREAAKAIK